MQHEPADESRCFSVRRAANVHQHLVTKAVMWDNARLPNRAKKEHWPVAPPIGFQEDGRGELVLRKIIPYGRDWIRAEYLGGIGRVDYQNLRLIIAVKMGYRDKPGVV